MNTVLLLLVAITVLSRTQILTNPCLPQLPFASEMEVINAYRKKKTHFKCPITFLLLLISTLLKGK